MATSEPPTQTASTVTAALDRLPERDRHVFVARTLEGLGSVPTLNELAIAWDITRQRVEQLQRRAEERIRTQLDQEQSVRALGRDLREALGVAFPLAALHTVPELGSVVAPEGHPSSERSATIRRTMVWFAGFLLKDGWALSRRGIRPQAMLKGLPERAQARGYLTYSEAVSELGAKGLVPQAADALLGDAPPNMKLFGGVFLHWATSLTDKAEVLLRWLDRPATDAELLGFIGEKRSLRGFRNRLTDDERFAFAKDRSAFVLRDWGLDEPVGLSDAIAAWIDKVGGEAVLADLVEDVANQGGWAKSSVRTYASAPRFVTNDGQVRLRRTDEPFEAPPADAATHPRVQPIDGDRIRYIIEVIADTLRGSGRVVPTLLATTLRVDPGNERTFASPSGGSVRIGWSMTSPQPNIGSVRALAESIGAELGDRMALDFDLLEGNVSVKLLPTSE